MQLSGSHARRSLKRPPLAALSHQFPSQKAAAGRNTIKARSLDLGLSSALAHARIETALNPYAHALRFHLGVSYRLCK